LKPVIPSKKVERELKSEKLNERILEDRTLKQKKKKHHKIKKTHKKA
jgi:hypothetical protein